jgi:2-keto-4-pentenoate hydratase
MSPAPAPLHRPFPRYRPRWLTGLAWTLAWAAGGAWGACATEAEADALAAAWHARIPLGGLDPAMTLEEALCTQAKLVARLAPKLGPQVGYKVGLTHPALQQRFGTTAPVRGVLLQGMFLPDGAEVPAGYGARPVVEADLLVRIGSAAVNQAATPAQALAALKEVIPFIELADLVLAEAVPANAALVTAVNVGARLGVLGAPLPAARLDPVVLETMEIVVEDGAGQVLARAPGSAVLGHPLNALLWLARDLERRGERLEPGDLVSLGAFSAPLAPAPGTLIRVRYRGLPGEPQVAAAFR